MNPETLALAAVGLGLLFALARGLGRAMKTASTPTSPVSHRTDSPPPKPVYYRTKDGKADYGFSIEQLTSGDYRVYIASLPNADVRLRAVHRLSDGSREFICWSARLRTEDDARQIAALWADRTQEFVRSGRGF